MKRLTLILASLGMMLLAGCKSDAPAVQAADVPAPPHAVFEEGLIADIEPQGWLLEMLQRQRDGLTGHPEAMAYPYDSPLWAGELKRVSSRGTPRTGAPTGGAMSRPPTISTVSRDSPTSWTTRTCSRSGTRT